MRNNRGLFLLGRSLLAAFILGLTVLQSHATPWNHTSWPPATTVSNTSAVVPISATVTVSPPTIRLNFLVAGTYQIFRKDPSATTWGAALGTTAASSTTYTDSTVNVGQLYEYKAIFTDGPTQLHVPNPQTFVGGNGPPIGYVMTGINVDETAPRGRLILLVASDVPTSLPTEYNQYVSDLQADGWFVHVISTAPGGYDVGGTNAAATITVTNGGTGYVAGATGTTDATGLFRFTAGPVTTSSACLGTITVSSGVITAVTITSGGAGGGFNVGDVLTLSNVKTSTGSGATFTIASVKNIDPNPAPIRDQIKAIYNQYPGEVKDLVILGRVPACRTGSKLIGDPDGHGVNDGATGADGYYANMTGTWTDTGSNLSNYNQGGITTGTGEINTPHDNKFDQYYMSQSGGQADLNFGRIDVSNNINGQYEGLKFYLKKLHRYKTASPDFQPGRKVIMRGGGFQNIDETGWTLTFSLTPHSVINALNNGANADNDVSLIGTADLPASTTIDGDAVYSAQNGPSLFYFKGSGGPGIGIGGKSVFWTGMQSHWGWWYSSTVSSGENTEQLRLAEDSFALSWTWDIFGTRYFYHRMAMGFDAGDMMRVSVNNVDSTNGTYAFTTINDGSYGGYIYPCTGALFMNHIGDPTLRLFMFPPPTALSVVASGGQPNLTWTASVPMIITGEPPVVGYHVYRAPLSAGVISAPYTRLTSSLVSGTTYTDTDPVATTGTGQWSYMVRAVRLETTGGGTFYNASLGAVQSIDQTNPPAALAVTSPATLPASNWNTAYATTLAASGGYPNYAWSLVSGNPPTGLTLNGDGSFSGVPTTAGTYTFTAKITDAVGTNVQQAFTLTTLSTNVFTLIPEVSAYTISTQATRVQGPVESMAVGPGNMSYIRWNISGLNTNNALVSAKLRLYAANGTSLSTNALLLAGLTPDATVMWGMDTLCWNNQPSDSTAVPPGTAATYPASLAYCDIDVTNELAYAIANNTTGKFGLRIYTLGTQTVNLCSRWSYGGAIPQLVIQTTNGPKITITSPTVNPAAIFTGSGLAINATVTPIPANAGTVTTQWSKVSGPGTVTFSSLTTPNTTAVFSAPGDYVLQLAANDTVLQSAQTLTVRVTDAPINGPIDSMVLHMPFSEASGTSTADTSGSNNNGTLAAGASFSTSGLFGNAVSFNGAQNVVITDSAANPNPIDNQGALTISMWVYPTQIDTDNLFRTLINKTGAFQLQFRNVSNGGQTFNSIAGIAAQQSTKRLVVNTWQNIVAVYNGADANRTLQLFINGLPDNVSSSAIATVPRKATASTFIGATSASDAHGFIGLIDEVRIYKRALTYAEVQDIAAGGPANVGPVITTTASLTGNAGQSLPLTATVTDDGKPLPASLAYNWVQLAGPSSLSILNPTTLNASTTPNSGGNYGIRLTVNDGSITTFADVAAAITGPVGVTYSSWAAGKGLTGNNALPTAILANDGLNNLYKYALGLDPFTTYNPGNAALPQVVTAPDTQHLQLSFNGAATDVTYRVQASSDLVTWTDIQVYTGGTAPGPQTVLDTQLIGATPKRFMRLTMTINP